MQLLLLLLAPPQLVVLLLPPALLLALAGTVAITAASTHFHCGHRCCSVLVLSLPPLLLPVLLALLAGLSQCCWLCLVCPQTVCVWRFSAPPTRYADLFLYMV
jgi:hypothetical protein